MSNTEFCKGTLIRVTLKFSLLDHTCFCYMRLSMMNFGGATLFGANFTGSTLEIGSVDFTNANLTGAILSDGQLNNSTIENALLPNQTWGPISRKNLVINGDLDQQNCTFNGDRFLFQWSIFFGVFRVLLNENPRHEKCYFRVVLFTWRNFAYLVRTISLENFTLLISSGHAQYHASATFQCSGEHYATMTIRHINENNLSDGGVSNETVHGTHVQSLIFSNNLRPDTRHVRIIITIFRPINETNRTGEDDHCACYNVKYVIIKSA